MSEMEPEAARDQTGATDAVVRLVDRRTGGQRPPLTTQSSLIGAMHNSSDATSSLEETFRAITSALATGDLFKATDDEGTVWIGIDDEGILVEKIAAHFSSVEDHRKVPVGLANARVQVLRHGDGGDQS